MTNSSLPQTGFSYTIDSSTVSQSAATIVQAQNRITQGQQQIIQRSESFDRAIGANNRSVRILAGELVNLTGAGGQATSILTSLLSAAGPLDAVIIGIGVAVGALKSEIDRENIAFQTETEQLARLATSYTDYAAARRQAAQNNPLSDSGIQQLFSDYEQIRNAIAPGFPEFLRSMQGVIDVEQKLFRLIPGIGGALADLQLNFKGTTETIKELTIGEFALGAIQNDRIRSIGQEITARAKSPKRR